MAEMRLQRYLAQAGVAARRKAEALITSGVVRVNGKVVRVLGTKVDPDSDKVSVNGEAVYPEDLFYVVLNKPKGCICAVSDPEGRITVMDYLPKVPAHVVPVGRLDYYTEGVLLLTNDGELSAALQSPRRHIAKTYHVKVNGKITDRELSLLRKGVKLDDGYTTREAQIDRLKAQSKHDWLVMTLTEGKNRQIHRMLESLGHRATKIQRVAFAGINYHGLRVGDARELTGAELKELRTELRLKANPRGNPRGKWRAKREDTDTSRKKKAANLAEAEALAKGLPAPKTGVAGRRAAAKQAASRRAEQAPTGRRGAGRAVAQSKAAKAAGAKKRPARGGSSTASPRRGSTGRPSSGRRGSSSTARPSSGRRAASSTARRPSKPKRR